MGKVKLETSKRKHVAYAKVTGSPDVVLWGSRVFQRGLYKKPKGQESMHSYQEASFGVAE